MIIRTFFIIFFSYNVNASILDGVFDEITSKELNSKKVQTEEIFEEEEMQSEDEFLKEEVKSNQNITIKSHIIETGQNEVCNFYQNAKLQITNKMEGKTYIFNLRITEDLNIEFLKIKMTKCCKTQIENSYAFLKVQNTKINKEIFSGWMFSSSPSKNPIEDAKFDLILLECF